MCGDLLPPAESVAAGVRFNLGSIQCDSFESDQAFRAQHPQHRREQVIESGLVLRPETRQCSMTHRMQSTQPLAARLILALPRQFPRRTDATAVSVQPQPNKQSRVRFLTPTTSFASANL